MMINSLHLTSVLASVLIFSGCTTFPSGPGILVLPGTGKDFDQFRLDDADCRQFASDQIGGKTVNDAAIDSGVKSAVIGTAIGAGAGALLGGHSGVGIGAGTGLLFGSIAGAGANEGSGSNLQQRYDFAYQQCMYSKGHRVPILGRMDSQQPVRDRNVVSSKPSGSSLSSPVRASMPPPPPAGTLPP